MVQVHDKRFRLFLSKETIAARVCAVAAQLNEDYAGLDPLFIGILNGSFIFASDLFRALTIPAEISFVKLASYKGTTSTGNVITAVGLDENLTGRHVVIVEDIIDTGRTLAAFMPEIWQRQPASVRIATFLRKPEAQAHDVDPSYVCFDIEDKFVVGYGLDYDGLGRQFPDLYVLAGD